MALFTETIAATATAQSGPATLDSINIETIAAGVAGSATLSRFASRFRTLGTTVTGVAELVAESLAGLTEVILSATATVLSGPATITSIAIETLSATVTASPTLNRLATFFRTLSASVTGVATMVVEEITVVTLQVLSATATGAAEMRRMHFKILEATVTGIVGAAAVLALLVLEAAATVSATLNRFASLFRVFSATVTGVATLAADFVLALQQVVFSATSTASAEMRRLHFKLMEAAAAARSGPVGLVSVTTLVLAASVTGVATIITNVSVVSAVIFSATATGVATLISVVERFVAPFTGHGGLGLGVVRKRWERRAITWRRRR